MNFSAEHNNWLTVGEMIRLIQKPISSYVNEIVKDFHKALCQDFDKNSSCVKANCKKITPFCGLCISCYGVWWLKKLQASHEGGKNPSWRMNCDGSKWYDDHWEIAKFFMPALGNNRSTVIDAKSTDLSSLLNVLEWMKDEAFLGKFRVNVDLVRKLRSEVRNTWAHASNQELSKQQKEDYFMIAANFFEDLKNVFPDETKEIEETQGRLDNLKANGVRNVVKSEIENLLLTFNTLSQIKEELVVIHNDSVPDRKAIEDLTSQLEQVKNAMNDCSNRMKQFENNQQFESLAQQLKSFDVRVSQYINDININIQRMTELQQDNKENGPELASCLPEKLKSFAARGKEIEDLIKFLLEENTGIVSLYGGPGFGKSALAVEVSHHLSDDHNILVIFTDLSSASSINEVTVRICRDVGINPEEDPRSSLSLMLKNLKKEVVFVLDDIENLLVPTIRSQFDEFVQLLRKNSNQKLKIITTSRSSYTIQNQSFQNIKIEEMDQQSSVVLLRSIRSNLQDEFLQSLAQLCGYNPLAMCIAISLVDNFDDPNEILKHLQVKPIRTLSNSETNQFVYKAFNTSYIHLTNEQRDALIRLTVFEGDFSENAAKAVLEGDDLQQMFLLIDLANRSLVKKSGSHRYSIHVLIKSFLSQQPESVEKRAKAERLMVAYYLHLYAESTIQSCSKDKFMENREICKREAHNIEKVLIICTSKQNESEILRVLVDSEIYNRLCRFFYNHVRTIISETVLANFLQSCADLAYAREEWSNKINFDCILADQEGRKSFWKSDEYFKKMKATEEEFKRYNDNFTENVALQAYFFYQLGRYFLNKSKVCKESGECESTYMYLAYKNLCKSLDLRKAFPDFHLGKVDIVLSLIQLGNLWKKIAMIGNLLRDVEISVKSNQHAMKYYREAIGLAETVLGKHEISAACYKILGDLFFQSQQNETAIKQYEVAKCMREELNLNTSEEYALLLKNIGRCLMFTKCYLQAIELLERARDIIEKLVDDDCPTVGKRKVYASLAQAYQFNAQLEKAKEFAEKALKITEEMNNTIINGREFDILQEIILNS